MKDAGVDRVFALADIHLGNPKKLGGPVTCGVNTRGYEVLAVVERVVTSALLRDATILVLGDVFDTSSPPPQLISSFMDLMNKAIDAGQRWELLVGNHDAFSADVDDHALGPMAWMPNVRVYGDQPTLLSIGTLDIVLVPYMTPVNVTTLTSALTMVFNRPKLYGRRRALALHAGIYDETFPLYLRGQADAVSVTELDEVVLKFDLDEVIAGNWHNAHLWMRDTHRILQTGALCPTGWDNEGPAYGYVWPVGFPKGRDPGLELRGPRFSTVRADHYDEDVAKVALGARTYVRLIAASSAELLDAERRIRLDLPNIDSLVFDKVISHKAATDAAEDAVVQALSSIDDSVAAFIEKMKLDDDVDRTAVHARVSKYLAR